MYVYCKRAFPFVHWVALRQSIKKNNKLIKINFLEIITEKKINFSSFDGNVKLSVTFSTSEILAD